MNISLEKQITLIDGIRTNDPDIFMLALNAGIEEQETDDYGIY